MTPSEPQNQSTPPKTGEDAPQSREQHTQNPPEKDGIMIDPRKQIRAQKIMKLLMQQTPYNEIAAQIGISRQQLYADINKEGHIRELIKAELVELRTTHMQQLEEMTQSKNPQDRRFALKERGVMIRHMEDKVHPKQIETRNLTVTATVDTKQRDRQIFNETLRKLPPNIRRLVTQTLEQTYKDHTQPTP